MADVTVVRAPVENVNDETIAIIRWLVDDGSFVQQGDPLVLAETTKTSFDIESPVSGFVWRAAAAGTDVPVGSVVCYVGDDLDRVKDAAGAAVGSGEPARVEPLRVASDAPASPRWLNDDAAGDLVAVAPLPARFSSRATALLQEHGLDAASFAGRGLVRERDVLAFRAGARGGARAALPSLAKGAGHQHPVTPAFGVAFRSEALSRSKRFEARHLGASAANTIHSAVTLAVPTFGFFSAPPGQGEMPGLPAAAVIYEAARLLRVHPVFNAFHAEGEVHYYDRVNVGYAIDAGHGLKVPVVHDADRQSLTDIADRQQRLLVDYLSESLSLESLNGGTFTVTDLSGEGVIHFHPVINDGQSAILGICAESFPVPGERGAFNLVLAFDHQLAEGRTAAAFLRDLRDRLMAHEASSRGARRAAAAEDAHCDVCLRPVAELDEARQFLVRTVVRGSEEQRVCTICLQDW